MFHELEIIANHHDRARECHYYLALGHYRLKNYSEAKRHAETILKNEPGNLQASSLLKLINDRVAQGKPKCCTCWCLTSLQTASSDWLLLAG